MQLVKYDAACRALAECRTIDEAKGIADAMERARLYARQMKNREAEFDCIEIRVRAERRLGQLIIDLRRSGQIDARGRRSKNSPRVAMRDIGLDGNLSPISQRLAPLEPEEFERELLEWRGRAPRMQRLEIPLQHIRNPASREYNRRVASRWHALVDAGNPLDPFHIHEVVRRVADWRVGSLKRIEQIGHRIARAAASIQAALPSGIYVDRGDGGDANWIVETVFPREELATLLGKVWEECPVGWGDTGVNERRRRDLGVPDRKRVCANPECPSPEFTLKRAAHANRPSEGRFCSRKCAATVTRRRMQHAPRAADGKLLPQ
jgi:hypothetical protein